MNQPSPGHRLLLLAIPRRETRDDLELRRLATEVRDWDLLLEEAERLGATALLGKALDDSGAPRPAMIDAAGRAALLRGTMRMILATRVLSDALAALARAAIEVVVLKGVPLAQELYDPPGMRPIGDLDLLVRRGDRESALRVLQSEGYRLPAGSLPLSFYFRHHFHVTLIRDGIEGLPIELHWQAQPRFSLSRIPVDALWRGRRSIPCAGTDVPVPGREETFLYLAQHFLRHLIAFGEASAADPVAAMLEPARRGRLTWLADLVLLARLPPGLDWERVDRLAVAWGLTSEIAGLRRYLAARGDAPDSVIGIDRGSGEGTLRIIRRLTRIFPSMARASGGLQLRPILIARLWRFAFPGEAWIRWRYGLGADSGAFPIGLRALRHASGVTAAAAWMLVAVPLAWIRSRFSRDSGPGALPDSDRNASGASPDCPPGIT